MVTPVGCALGQFKYAAVTAVGGANGGWSDELDTNSAAQRDHPNAKSRRCLGATQPSLVLIVAYCLFTWANASMKAFKTEEAQGFPTRNSHSSSAPRLPRGS